MELINNRYRVVEVLEKKYMLTTYLVTDILRNYEPLFVKILNVENVQKNILNYMKSGLIRLKGANNSGVVNLLQLGLINNIDNRSLKNSKYFYTTEVIKTDIDFLKYVESFSDEEKLGLFVEVCKTIN